MRASLRPRLALLALGSVGLLVAVAGAGDLAAGDRGRYWVCFAIGTGLGAAAVALVMAILAIRARDNAAEPRIGVFRTPGARWSAILYGAGIAGLLRLGPSGLRAGVIGAGFAAVVVLALAPGWMLVSRPEEDGN